jgi:putative FmdB family regulatory protein
MAKYDFTCQECGCVFEDRMDFNDPLPGCPKCKKSDVLRHFPCPAVHFHYSPMHPRANRGKLGIHTPSTKPQFRSDAPYLKKKKRK